MSQFPLGYEKLWQSLKWIDSTLLITGETGTGKSHLAKQIHQISPRCNKKFMSINLATLSSNLVESELFGHEKGAFSSADNKRIGRLEMAQGGTIFLDEIGELPLPCQSKLLEFMQRKIIIPVGSNKEIKIDARIIAATNKNIPLQIKEKKFREDLFYRINTLDRKNPRCSIWRVPYKKNGIGFGFIHRWIKHFFFI